MEHKGIFPIGIEVDGVFHKEYSLEEERFKHTLAVYTDQQIAREALQDPAFHAAAVLAKRLKVTDIETVTPEMVLDLFPEDGNDLGTAGAILSQRRTDFRKSPGDKGSTGNGDSADKDRLSS